MKRMSEDMCPSVYTNFPIDTTVDAHALDSAVIAGYLEATSEKVYTQNEVVAMLKELKEEFEDLDPSYDCNTYYAALRDCSNLLQQKIDKLREGEL